MAHGKATSDKVNNVLSSLRDFIIEGSIQSGTDLPPEKELARELRVSRFILREALRVAQFQGLIEISRGSRTKVAEVSIQPAIDVMNILLRRSAHVLLDLSEAREGLECAIVELAAVRAESALIMRMDNTIIEIEDNRDDLDRCIDRDIEFHNLIVKASKNDVFKIMIAPVNHLLRQSRLETMRTYGLDTAIREHRAILKAILERDPKKAKSRMRDHIQTAKKQLVAIGLSGKNGCKPQYRYF